MMEYFKVLDAISKMDCPYLHGATPGEYAACEKCLFRITVYDNYCLIRALDMEPDAEIVPLKAGNVLNQTVIMHYNDKKELVKEEVLAPTGYFNVISEFALPFEDGVPLHPNQYRAKVFFSGDVDRFTHLERMGSY